MKQCLKITVSGDVQGVGYRTYVQKEAQKLKLEGTVQNEDDGTVLVMACGDSNSLDNFIDILYAGTSKSNVASVHAEPLANKKDFRSVFRVIGLGEK